MRRPIDSMRFPGWVERGLQTCVAMDGRRILLLHQHHGLRLLLDRLCGRYGASLEIATTQSKVVELLSAEPDRADLVIAKDVAPDWFTMAAALLACRAFGVITPFIISGDPVDRWTRYAVECAGSAVLVDDRVSLWLLPAIVDDWLISGSQQHPDVPDEAGRLRV